MNLSTTDRAALRRLLERLHEIAETRGSHPSSIVLWPKEADRLVPLIERLLKENEQ